MEAIPEEMQRVTECAMRILACRDNTEKVLRRKLHDRGFSEEETDFAVRYVVTGGYLNEERMLVHAVYALSRRHYGKRRIVTELYRLGFSREAIARGIEQGCFADIDFLPHCVFLLRHEGGELDDRTVAKLQRYGYTLTEMKQAHAALGEE